MPPEYVTKEMCALHHSDMNKRLDALQGLTEDIHRRLFIDNGSPSVQTRLDRTDRILNVFMWVATTAGGAMIAALAVLWIKTP